MKKSDLIFWATLLFIASWIIGFFMGVESMIMAWFVWLIALITVVYVTSFHKFLRRFD